MICSVPVQIWNLSSGSGVVLFGLSPQKWESKQGSLGAVVLALCVFPFLNLQWSVDGFFQFYSWSLERSYVISYFMLYPTSSLFCLYGFYLYPSFKQDDLCRVLVPERLCCRMFTAVGIAHLSIQTGFSPFLISRQIFLIIQGKMWQMSFRFSHQPWFIFALSTSILFMFQVMSGSGIHIRRLICLNWDLKTSCSLAALSAQGLEWSQPPVCEVAKRLAF